jgi:hypothetical protein
MTKNPVINAFAAAAYIGGIVSLLSLFVDSKVEQTIPLLIPMVMISLFTLSAAVMGLIFFYEPFRMYFADEKEAAIKLVVQTVLTFAVLVALLLVAVITLAQ